MEDPVAMLQAYDLLSSRIYQVLIQDIESHLQLARELVIVPDQNLGYVSFESLCINPDANLVEKYSITNYAVQYAYSGTHFSRNTSARHKISEGTFGGFAPSYSTPEGEADYGDPLVSRLYRAGNFALPGARHEVESIHELMGGDKWLDNEATETMFKETVGDYDLIHLSLHGIINDEQPLYSKLAFASKDTLNDGFLNAYEIYQLPLKADLVVLSACNTGLGKLEKGEGVMSLARSFAYAGCPSLIASLWKADDQATADIMVRFYENVQANQTVSTALRQAKMDYLANQKVEALRHPYFWSAFVLYSQANPVTSSLPLLLWIGVAMVGLLIFLLIRFGT